MEKTTKRNDYLTKAKILIFDVENSPAISYNYGLFKQNIGTEMVIETPYLFSYAAKWLGEDHIYYEEQRGKNDAGLVKGLYDLLDEADMAVAHFGSGHDFPFILGRGAIHGFKPYSPVIQIDTCKIARRKFKMLSNKLSFLAKQFGVTPKDDHPEYSGFNLWKAMMAGDAKAWEVNRRYNIGDVVTLEELYLKMRPYIDNHPNVSREAGEEVCQCPSCGSDHVQKRGLRFEKSGLAYQRFQCQACGSWSKTKRSEKDFGQNVLRSI